MGKFFFVACTNKFCPGFRCACAHDSIYQVGLMCASDCQKKPRHQMSHRFVVKWRVSNDKVLLIFQHSEISIAVIARILRKCNGKGKTFDADGAKKPTPQHWPTITDMYAVSMFISANAVADVFPQPRGKYMDALGAVVPVRFISAGNHAYTGLLKGAEHGLLRAGMALPSRPMDGKYFGGVILGVALNFFRDGLPRSNIVFIPDVKFLVCNSNFFDGLFSAHIAQIDPETSPFLSFASRKFPQAIACGAQVGTSAMTARGGQISDGEVFPFKVALSTK